MEKGGRAHIPKRPKNTFEKQRGKDCKLTECKVYFSLLDILFCNFSYVTAEDSAEHVVDSQ